MEIETLAEIADRRQISPVLEHAWEARTGVNPLAAAVLQRKRDQGDLNLQRFGFYLLGVATILTIFFFWTANLSARAPEMFREFVWQEIGFVANISMYFAALSLAAGFCLVVVLRYNTSKTREAEIFGRDLDLLIEWSRLSLSDLEALKDGSLKDLASTMLVQSARTVLEGEVSIKTCPDNVHGGALYAAVGWAKDSFKEKHQVLVRLGLANEVWDGYFRQAQIKLDPERAKVSEIAEAADRANHC